MSITELLPAVKTLPRADKLRLMQFLVIDLAHEEGVPLLVADAEYPIWTPLMPSRQQKHSVMDLIDKEEVMTLIEILPAVRQLPTLDKIRLIRDGSLGCETMLVI